MINISKNQKQQKFEMVCKAKATGLLGSGNRYWQLTVLLLWGTWDEKFSIQDMRQRPDLLIVVRVADEKKAYHLHELQRATFLSAIKATFKETAAHSPIYLKGTQ